MKLALFGRLLCGFGSAEVINRQLISACVSYQHMTRASAMFVSISAIGMSIGPLIAAILDMTGGRDIDVDIRIPLPGVNHSGGIVLDHCTDPGKRKRAGHILLRTERADSLLLLLLTFPSGFLMAFLWLLQLLSLVFLFTEPERINCVTGANTKTERNSESIWMRLCSLPPKMSQLFKVIFSNEAFLVSSYK